MLLCLWWLVVTLELWLLECCFSTWLASLLLLCLCSNWCCSLLRAQVGKRQACNASLKWSSSLANSVGVLETTLTLCARVLYILLLAVIKWLLSQCRYWSVCVGFLYAVVWMVLFSPGVTLVSRNWMEPSVPGCSTVNCMLGSREVVCWSGCVLCSALWMTRVSSTNLSQRWRLGDSAKGFNLKLFHDQVGYLWTDGRTHGCTMTCSEYLPWKRIFEIELQWGDYLLDFHLDPLW